jgi:hypothetical protein
MNSGPSTHPERREKPVSPFELPPFSFCTRPDSKTARQEARQNLLSALTAGKDNRFQRKRQSTGALQRMKKGIDNFQFRRYSKNIKVHEVW